MKKLRLTLILVFILALGTLALTSCKDKSLSSPTGLMFDVETQTLSWKVVRGAKFYTVSISGEEQDITTKKTEISLEDLDPGDYEIRIAACSGDDVFEDSDWTVYSFTREVESGLKYQLINNDTEFQLVGGGKASGDVVMESIYRGKPVTSIKEKALYGNTKITSITISDTVKTIGEKAFSKCSKLKTVTIPESVVSIGANAFQSCKSLESITLPNSVTEISPNLFDWCSALTTVTLGNNVTYIGEYAFANCEALVNVTYSGADNSVYKATLPDSLKVIAQSAFTDCYSLTSLSLGNGVETIGRQAFFKARSLVDLDLGSSLVSIGENAFAYGSLLTSVSVPDSTVNIEGGAFGQCPQLTSVSLGTGLRSIGSSVFYMTALLDNAGDMLIVDGWLISYTNNVSKTLSLSDEVYGIASYAVAENPTLEQADLKGVRYVGYASFFNCASLYRVAFDDALTEIGNYSFSYCPFLSSVSLGEGLASIGDYAFYGCDKLYEMTFPDSLTSIGKRAFRNTGAYNKSPDQTVYIGNWAVDYKVPNALVINCVVKEGTRGIANYTYSGQQLIMMTIKDSVEYIGRGAFYKCPIYNVNLPSSLKRIDDYAFYGCTYANFGGNYYDLVIPRGTEYVGRSAFYNCSNVLSVDIPGSVKSIGDYAFYGCKVIGLTVEFAEDSGEVDEDGNPIVEQVPVTGYIKLGEGIESIGDRAFQGCMSLESIVIPNSVTHLGSRVFYKCASLKSVTIGSGIEEINDYLFYKCEKLESVVVSDSLHTVGDYAFRGCTALRAFDPKQITSIGRYAFYGCSSLERIILPETLVSIGDYAFRGCTAATSIIIPDTVELIGKHVFYGLNGTTLYCESEAVREDWNVQFNSSFRPIFLGCTLSEDKDYVVSVTVSEDTLANPKAKNGISAPERDGYVFAGWATEQSAEVVEYTSENVGDAPSGTILYSVWTKQP